MIKFRQKEFIGVGTVVGLAGQLLGGGGPDTSTKFGKAQVIAGGVSNTVQNRRDYKLRKEELESNNKARLAEIAARSDAAKVTANANKEAIKAAAKAGGNITVNSNMGPQNQEQPSQVMYSTRSSRRKKKEALGFVKNIGTLAKERGLHKAVAGALVGGAITGTGAYLVDKGIQRDIKKEGDFEVAKPELTDEEKKELRKKKNRKLILTGASLATAAGGTLAAKKGYLGKDAKKFANKYISLETAKKAGNTIKDAARDYFVPEGRDGVRRPDILGLASTGVGLAIPAVLYKMNKNNYKNQIKQSSGNEEEEKSFSKKISPTPKIKIKVKPDINKKRGSNYISSGGSFTDYGGFRNFRRQFKSAVKESKQGLKDRWEYFKANPGKAILGKLSSDFGGGGREGVAKFGEDLRDLGKKTKNKTSQKLGQYIIDNSEKALAASIPLGGVVLGGIYKRTKRVGSDVIEKLDPDAYAYNKYGVKPKRKAPENDNDDKEEEMNKKYNLKRKTFAATTRYDETDNLKRMKDSDILAEQEKRADGSGFKGVLMDTAVGLGTGALVGAATGLLAKRNKLNKVGRRAKTGALIGGLAMAAAGLNKRRADEDNRDFYNRRLRYAQSHARRREALDWTANMTQRDGYSY